MVFHANIFLISKMGSIIKFIGKLTKIHQKYMSGKIVIFTKTKICKQTTGIQVSTVLRMKSLLSFVHILQGFIFAPPDGEHQQIHIADNSDNYKNDI